MDEMKLNLRTKFMKKIVEKLIVNAVKKKTGYKIDLVLDELLVEMVNGEAHLHVNADCRLNKEQFMKALRMLSEDESL